MRRIRILSVNHKRTVHVWNKIKLIFALVRQSCRLHANIPEHSRTFRFCRIILKQNILFLTIVISTCPWHEYFLLGSPSYEPGRTRCVGYWSFCDVTTVTLFWRICISLKPRWWVLYRNQNFQLVTLGIWSYNPSEAKNQFFLIRKRLKSPGGWGGVDTQHRTGKKREKMGPILQPYRQQIWLS